MYLTQLEPVTTDNWKHLPACGAAAATSPIIMDMAQVTNDLLHVAP